MALIDGREYVITRVLNKNCIKDDFCAEFEKAFRCKICDTYFLQTKNDIFTIVPKRKNCSRLVDCSKDLVKMDINNVAKVIRELCSLFEKCDREGISLGYVLNEDFWLVYEETQISFKIGMMGPYTIADLREKLHRHEEEDEEDEPNINNTYSPAIEEYLSGGHEPTQLKWRSNNAFIFTNAVYYILFGRTVPFVIAKVGKKRVDHVYRHVIRKDFPGDNMKRRRAFFRHFFKQIVPWQTDEEWAKSVTKSCSNVVKEFLSEDK